MLTKRWHGLLASLLLMVFSLLLCELVLQVAAWQFPRLKYEINAPWTRNVVPDPSLGYRMSPYFPGHDRYGFRNDGDSTSYDIVAIGDSLTYGFGADAHGSWPRLLSNLSERSVYNAGVGGYGPCEYYRLADEMTRYRPRLVILGLYLGNDLANAYTSVYNDGRCPELSTKDPSTLRAIERENQRVDLHDVARQYRGCRAASAAARASSAIGDLWLGPFFEIPADSASRPQGVGRLIRGRGAPTFSDRGGATFGLPNRLSRPAAGPPRA